MNLIDYSTINLSAIYSLNLISAPCIYLYFKNLLRPIKRFEIINLLHFIFPGVLFLYFGVLNYTKNQIEIIKVLEFGVLIFIFFYIVKILHLFYKNLQNEKELKIIYQKHYSAIKNWILFLFVITILVLLRLLIVLVIEIYTGKNFSGNSYSIFKNLLFLALISKILISPEILFGYPKLIKQLKYLNVDENINSQIWINTVEEKISIQEAKLRTQITKKTNSYIQAIDHFTENKNPFRDSKYTIKDLANDLKIPSSHLAYIYKYHCKIAFVEYKNYAKINDALRLINEGFLNSKTLDALAYNVGFKSYNSFFVSFKKYTNYAPKEYLLKNDKIKDSL